MENACVIHEHIDVPVTQRFPKPRSRTVAADVDPIDTFRASCEEAFAGLTAGRNDIVPSCPELPGEFQANAAVASGYEYCCHQCSPIL